MTKGVAEGNLLLELWFPKDKEHRLHRDSSHIERPESANSHLFLWEGLGLVGGRGGQIAIFLLWATPGIVFPNLVLLFLQWEKNPGVAEKLRIKDLSTPI